jgi:hypothetical protein
MFKTSDTRRIRLRGTTPVHDVPVPHSSPVRTACGRYIKLFDARGRVLDRPLSDSDDIAVTCRACLRAAPT